MPSATVTTSVILTHLHLVATSWHLTIFQVNPFLLKHTLPSSPQMHLFQPTWLQPHFFNILTTALAQEKQSRGSFSVMEIKNYRNTPNSPLDLPVLPSHSILCRISIPSSAPSCLNTLIMHSLVLSSLKGFKRHFDLFFPQVTGTEGDQPVQTRHWRLHLWFWWLKSKFSWEDRHHPKLDSSYYKYAETLYLFPYPCLKSWNNPICIVHFFHKTQIHQDYTPECLC